VGPLSGKGMKQTYLRRREKGTTTATLGVKEKKGKQTKPKVPPVSEHGESTKAGSGGGQEGKEEE